MTTLYTVFVDYTATGGTETYSRDFGTLEAAARHWDSLYIEPGMVAEISVQQFDADGVMVRNGNVISVDHNQIYLLPTILTTLNV